MIHFNKIISLLMPLFFIGVTLTSCKDEMEEEVEPNFIIVDTIGLKFNLTWSLPGNENGFEEADLDLAISDATDNTININTSEFGDRFERINFSSTNSDNTFNVRVRYYESKSDDSPLVNYILTVSNADSTISKTFSNTISAPPTENNTSWIDPNVEIVTVIWKEGSSYTFLN